MTDMQASTRLPFPAPYLVGEVARISLVAGYHIRLLFAMGVILRRFPLARQ